MSARGTPIHLARRFLTSLSTRPPPAVDEAWARDQLRPAELERWVRLGPQDRRHSIAVARAVSDRDCPWLVRAALLHDIGKADPALGVFGRVLATLCETIGITAPGRIGRFQDYPSRGASFLADAGSEPEVRAWAREHHLAPSAWTIPAPEAHALAEADRRG